MYRYFIERGRTAFVIGVVLLAMAMMGIAVSAKADDATPHFAGRYSNQAMTVELSESGGGYVGTITKGENQFPLKTSVTPQGLAGAFTASGTEFAITATLVNDQLLLVSGGQTYTLTRAAAQSDKGSSTSNNFGGNGLTFGSFSVLGSNQAGQTLFLKLPGGLKFDTAITQTADELGKVLDAKPDISGAFVDSKTQTKGGATLTGKFKGQNIKGTILVGTAADSGSADVIIARADASKEDTSALADFLPKPLKMTTNRFPDNSGSIDLPAGWKTPTVTASGPVVAMGPSGQTVVFCSITPIYDPNCRTVRLTRSNYQLAQQNYQRQMQAYQHSVDMKKQFPNIAGPGNPPQAPVAPDADPNDTAMKTNSPLRYCKFCDGPEEVLKVWYPLQENLYKKYQQPYTSLDKVIAIIDNPVDPAYPGTKCGTAYIAVTDHNGDKATRYRALNQIITGNVMEGEVWQLNMCVMRAPDATFDKDLPVMSAIMNSVNLDMKVVTSETAAQGAAVRKMGQDMFDSMERQHTAWQDQQAQQFHDHEVQMAAQQKAMHDSSSDMIEFALGLRNVYDTNTGQWHQVDLLNATGIVEAENALVGDPNRFVAVPLRYTRQ
jgi:hypothetical protein